MKPKVGTRNNRLYLSNVESVPVAGIGRDRAGALNRIELRSHGYFTAMGGIFTVMGIVLAVVVVLVVKTAAHSFAKKNRDEGRTGL